MNQNRSKPELTFAENVVFNLLSLAAPLLFAFIATPLLVRGLGLEQYGYYSLVLAMIGFGFTTGIGRMPAKYIPEKRAANLIDELPPLLTAVIFITLAVALLEAGGLAVLSPLLVSQLLKVPEAASGKLETAIYIACLIGIVMMLSQLFQSALQGVHRFRAFASITIFGAFLLNLGSVILAVTSFPYTDIFVWNLTVTAVAAVLFFVFAKADVPEFVTRPTYDATVFTKVGRFAASIFVYQSITSVFYLFERSYILRNYGPEALTFYTIPLMLGIYLHAIVLAVSQVTIPKFNERVLDGSALFAIYQTLTKLVVSVSVYLFLMYYFLGSELLELWLGQDFAERSSGLLAIDGAAFALIALLIPTWILSEAARKPGINASSPLTTYLFGMAAIVLLNSQYQIEGIALGRLVGAVAALPIIFIVERLVFGKVMLEMWAGILLRVTSASLALLLIDRFLTSKFSSSWETLVTSVFAITLPYWVTLLLLKYTHRAEVITAFGPSSDKAKNAEQADAMQ